MGGSEGGYAHAVVEDRLREALLHEALLDLQVHANDEDWTYAQQREHSDLSPESDPKLSSKKGFWRNTNVIKYFVYTQIVAATAPLP